ncbi:metallophosphoesterase [Candidatus Caldatribacterium sp.]|uniref:metallophosphoesterase n=1 Tax=Candidatus Caldatribacterium sp. TaxID=2282143 RepID=UPI0029997209|nr:metallophosphoesterase [Candidatus Caldatribacterium sp.]MDW8081211.1 metallophosphoesterase [Candidatus Calescibacterium sp.]
MKVGVLSDSHDHLPLLRKALDVLQKEGAELILHAGDYVAPFSVAVLAELTVPWWGVLGNNDGEILGIFQKSEGRIKAPFLELEEKGYRIFVSHFYQPAKLALASGHYDLVVYGHTHEAIIKEEGRTILVNPGEVCGLLSGRPTVAFCDLERKVAKLLDI